MAIAKRIKKMDNFRGIAYLYELDKPHCGHNYIVVSTSDVPFSGIETYIFPATKTGDIVDWGELDGSIRGTSSHTQVLNSVGYDIEL